MKKLGLLFIVSISIFYLSAFVFEKLNEGHWTHFRGSALNGIADAEHCPIKWTPPVLCSDVNAQKMYTENQ